MAWFFLLCFVVIGPNEDVDTIGTAVAVTHAHCGTAWDEMTDVQYDGYIFTLPDCYFLGGWMKMSKSMQDFTAWYDRSHQPQSVGGTQTLGRMSAWEFRTHLPMSEVRSKKGKLCFWVIMHCSSTPTKWRRFLPWRRFRACGSMN